MTNLGRQDAIEIFNAAVAAVKPARLLSDNISVTKDYLSIGAHTFLKNSISNIYVIGAGKAASAMATETEKLLNGYLTGGLVTTKYGHALPTKKIKIIEGAHPVPDVNCVEAVKQTLQVLKGVNKGDIVICLLSGGASALWCDVPGGATLEEVQTTFDYLIKCGAAIGEVNTVRKHLSGIKGGQLITHCGGAIVISLIISDVPMDDPGIIASGPTVADSSTFQIAFDLLLKYNLLPVLPQSVLFYIEQGVRGIIAETPKPGDPIFQNTINKIIGNNRMALLAAADKAKDLGYQVQILDNLITGDAAAEAKKLVAYAAAYRGKKPVCIVQGGETTVKVTGSGKGGRNQHFTLVALKELMKLKHTGDNKITILSGGTDGTDGPTDATGGIVNIETFNRAMHKGIDIETYLNKQDAYHFLEQTDSLFITGPTQTNVMDVMMAIVH